MGDFTNSVLSIVITVVVFILPIINRKLIKDNFERLEDDDVADNLGMFYEGYRTDELRAAYFGAWSLTRRLLIVFVLIFCQEQNWLQCILIMWISTFNIVYLVEV